MKNSINLETFFKKNIVIIICAIICTALWGSAFPCIKLGYQLFNIKSRDVFSQILFAGIRFLLAGILVILINIITDKKFPIPKREAIKGITLLGFVQTTLEYVFFYIGLSYASSFKGAIINPTSTFMMVILAHFVYKNDKLNLQKIIGCSIGFIGIIIVNLGSSATSSDNHFLGESLLFLSAFAFAIGSIISKQVTQIEKNPMTVTGYQLSIGGFILIALGILGNGKINFTSTSALLLLLYLSFLSAVAFSLWTTLFKYNPVGKISIYNFLTPIFGTFLSAIILSEDVFKLKNFIALILVCLGIYIVSKTKDKSQDNTNDEKIYDL